MSEAENTSPSELDLQAYLDNELTSGERVKIIEWLIEHPEDGKKLFEMQLREDLLRTAVWQSVNGADLDETLLKSIRGKSDIKPNQSGKLVFSLGFVAGLIVAAFISLLF